MFIDLDVHVCLLVCVCHCMFVCLCAFFSSRVMREMIETERIYVEELLTVLLVRMLKMKEFW